MLTKGTLQVRTNVLHQKRGRPNIVHVHGQSKLANVAPIPCTFLGDQVRLNQSSLYRKGKGDAWTERNRRERTDEWASIQQWTLWPEQELYEQLRPILLFGETVGQRAKEINAAQRTLSRKADEFERDGMRSLFPFEEPREQGEATKTLSSEMRQLIVDVHAELPSISWREIAEICYIRYGRKPSHHSVKHVAIADPFRSLTVRRYQPWHLIADPAERKLAVIRLHSEGWSITSIAEYLATSRHTVYDTLKRWTEEAYRCDSDEKVRRII